MHPQFSSMKIQVWSVGKSHEAYVKEGIEMFSERIKHYFPISWKIIPPPKNAGVLTMNELKKTEGTAILSHLSADDVLITLDERGKQFTSEQLAQFLQKKANESSKNLIFLIGGAFGISQEVASRANFSLSLSAFVFPHQLVRLIIAEQIYRACTIIRNEKYHHS